jgi:hypothetical protein
VITTILYLLFAIIPFLGWRVNRWEERVFKNKIISRLD